MSPSEALKRAAALLSDNNLVWSSDFEVVREFLAGEFAREAEAQNPRVHLIAVARKILEV